MLYEKSKSGRAVCGNGIGFGYGGGYAAPKSDNSEVVTVFDPATYKSGEVVEINGEKYLKIVSKEGGVRVMVDPVSLKGKKTFSVTIFGAKADSGHQISLQLLDLSDGDNWGNWRWISLISTMDAGIPATPTIKRGSVATAKDNTWDGFQPSKKMLCTDFIVHAETLGDWKSQSGFTLYIGKITAF